MVPQSGPEGLLFWFCRVQTCFKIKIFAKIKSQNFEAILAFRPFKLCGILASDLRGHTDLASRAAHGANPQKFDYLISSYLNMAPTQKNFKNIDKPPATGQASLCEKANVASESGGHTYLANLRAARSTWCKPAKSLLRSLKSWDFFDR